MSKILLTGCAGLFGTHLSRYFTNKNYKVIGIDNLSGGYIEYIDPASTFIHMDLLDHNRLDSVFKEYKPNYVIHTAAMAAVCLSPFIRNYNYQNNLVAYANLVNCAINHNIKRFINFSSMDVYGKNQVPFLENYTPKPEDPYGIAKYSTELDLQNAYSQFGLNYNIIRPHNVFGKMQNYADKYRNVISIWIRKCLNGEPITVYGDGKQVRAFSDIKYYMKPVEKLLFDQDINQEIFNIGADNPITILEVANLTKKIAKKLGYKSNIIHLEARNEIKQAFPNHDKAKQKLNFVDNTDLEKTIEETFIWVSNQPKRKVNKASYEIVKNLYSYWK